MKGSKLNTHDGEIIQQLAGLNKELTRLKVCGSVIEFYGFEFHL